MNEATRETENRWTGPSAASIEAFRAAGHEMVDFVAAYWSSLQQDGKTPDVASDTSDARNTRGTIDASKTTSATSSGNAGVVPGSVASSGPASIVGAPLDADVSSVRSRAQPGDLLRALPMDAPEVGEAWSSVMADVQRLIMPGITHWQHPSFFGYFPANTSGPAVLGEMLSAGLGVQGMLWSTSPACTELEIRVLDWLGKLVGLPAKFLHQTNGAHQTHGQNESNGPRHTDGAAGDSVLGGSVIMSTASEAAVVALVAARHRAASFDGVGADASRPVVVYTSSQAHSSIIKAAMIAGICPGPGACKGDATFIGASTSSSGVRLISVDSQGAMNVPELAEMIRRDLASGKRPIMIAATVGTTGTMGLDDVHAIGEIARGCGAWLHVDAAYAGSACVCPEHQWMLHGHTGNALQHVDSLCFNPHKWLLTNFDCTAFYVADRTALTGALSITPEYLRNAASDSGKVIDYRDWQIPLGRRFRALKLWFVLRMIGAAGLREYIREHVRVTRVFRELVAADGRFEMPCAGGLGLACFRLAPKSGENAEQIDARNRRLMERLNSDGRMFLTHTLVPGDGPSAGRVILRMSIGGTFTREEHVRSAWAEIQRAVTNVG